ncbi:hypothetical protein EDC18_102394 [Natranaerovirga pectinivora]|uniref:Uncharacterized protein n=1 Tax=Natranaerovirga pectinivora TaxID=682400 RepID=A0A4R3MN07_9FIRM|nr:hypothetical protein [Natranaerovirga pectinivora]TCT16375.1 hypothetical protein EDC18_102394 [Natranaerovirga pectinivora]
MENVEIKKEINSLAESVVDMYWKEGCPYGKGTNGFNKWLQLINGNNEVELEEGCLTEDDLSEITLTYGQVNDLFYMLQTYVENEKIKLPHIENELTKNVTRILINDAEKLIGLLYEENEKFEGGF